MAYAIGVFLALGVSLLANLVGFDRGRGFYPVVMIVIASYYGLFAVMGGSLSTLAIEGIPIGGFVVASVIGFKRNLWIVVGALAAHAVFDFFHRDVISNPGVPAWWPTFCLTYDMTAAGCLAWLLRRPVLRAKPVDLPGLDDAQPLALGAVRPR